MRRVTCEECGRSYDYDAEDLCPRCGSFNPPPDEGATTLERELLSRFRFAAQADRTHAHTQASEVFQHEGKRVRQRVKTVRRRPAGKTPPVVPAGKGKKKENPVGLVIAILLFLLWCVIMALE